MYKSEAKDGSVAMPKIEVRDDTTAHRHVRAVLRARLQSRLDQEDILDMIIRQLGLTHFVVAGGALLKEEPRDIDIWPAPYGNVAAEQELLVHIPAGKTSVKIDVPGGTQLQLCRQRLKSVDDLIKNFDFAHCQVGAEVRVILSNLEVGDVYFTPAFQAAMMVQGTFYTNAHWPKNGLERVHRIALKLGLGDDEARALTRQVVREMSKMRDAGKDPFGDVPVNEVLGVPDTPKHPGKLDS